MRDSQPLAFVNRCSSLVDNVFHESVNSKPHDKTGIHSRQISPQRKHLEFRGNEDDLRRSVLTRDILLAVYYIQQ